MSEHRDNSRGLRITLCGIVAVALLVRLAHLWSMSQGAWIDRHLTATEADDYAFFQWAQTIIAGDWLGRDTYHPYFGWMQEVAPLEQWYTWWGGREIFHQAPFYPYLLAALLSLCRGSVQLVLAAQMLIGSLHVLVMYGLAARIFDWKTGLVAALITALYGPLIFHEGMLLRDWLVPVVEPLAILLLLSAKDGGAPIRWVLAGAALGLALLCKASALLLVPPALAWLVHDQWESRRKATWAAALVLLGVLLSTSPLLIRNAVVGAPLLALSNRAIEAFVFGNAPSLSVIETSEGQLSGAVRGAVAYYRQRSLFDRQLHKARMFVSAHETANNTSYYYGLENSPLLRWMLGYAFLLPFGAAGLAFPPKVRRDKRLVVLYGLATLGGMLLTSPIARYRLAIVPFLTVFAAAALVHLADAIRRKRARPAMGILGIASVAAVIQQTAGDRFEAPSLYLDYRAALAAYQQRGDLSGAAAEAAGLYRAAVSHGSRTVAYEAAGTEAELRIRLAVELLAEGETTLAKEQAALAAAAYSKHPDIPSASFNLGLLYARLGDTAKAIAALEHFTEAHPDHARSEAARKLLAKLRHARGDGAAERP